MRRIPQYQWLEHTADVMIRLTGSTETDLYESAALALTELIAEIPTDTEREDALVVAGATPEERLHGLLRELIFRFDVDGTLFVAAAAELENDRLHFSGRVVEFDPERHVGLREVKAVTHHRLQVYQDQGKWYAEVVFDV